MAVFPMSRKRVVVLVALAVVMFFLFYAAFSAFVARATLKGLLSDDPQVRAAAVKKVANGPDLRAIGALADIVDDNNGDYELQNRARLALVAIGEPAIIVLMRACCHQRPEWLEWIWRIWKGSPGIELEMFFKFTFVPELGDRAVDPLIEITGDSDYRVRALSARMLGDLRSPRAVGSLVKLLKDEARVVGRAAAWALGEIGGPAALEALLSLVNQPVTWLVPAASEALGKIGDKAAVEPLLGVMAGSGYGVRVAAEALGRLRDPRAVPALIKALKSQDLSVRRRAAVALGRIGDASATAPLAALLKADTEVRPEAAEALETIGTREARAHVDALLAEADLEQLARHYEVIIREGNESSIVPLVAALFRYGDLDMAVALRGCGPSSLTDPAARWAENNGRTAEFDELCASRDQVMWNERVNSMRLVYWGGR